MKQTDLFRRWHPAIVGHGEVQLCGHDLATISLTHADQFFDYVCNCVLQLCELFPELLRTAKCAVLLPAKVRLKKLSVASISTLLMIDPMAEPAAKDQALCFTVELVRMERQRLHNPLRGCAVATGQRGSIVLWQNRECLTRVSTAKLYLSVAHTATPLTPFLKGRNVLPQDAAGVTKERKVWQPRLPRIHQDALDDGNLREWNRDAHEQLSCFLK
jgi:hypothetical protein